MKKCACIWMVAVLSCISVIAKPTKSSIGARNGVGGSGKALPYDAEVEYLESTGTQYIDTEVPMDSSQIIDLTFSLVGDTRIKYETFCGANWNDTASGNLRFSYIRQKSSEGLMMADGFFKLASNVIPWESGIIYKCHAENNNSSIELNDGRRYDLTSGPISEPNTIYLFATNNRGTASYSAKARVFSYRVLQSGVLVRDFIPVRVGTEGAMYDRVSGQLFRNQGTGAFLIGPDR